ncbi:unnamed protein product [Prorocentrum cordatum]|uniref:Uncharacterized protein n=1 Tax=Prorocentrum cordatum TaxID=2364126 RepID=A0ABN9PXV0_9DINO|nr:unnamed protein product [Polarella glacialis]
MQCTKHWQAVGSQAAGSAPSLYTGFSETLKLMRCCPRIPRQEHCGQQEEGGAGAGAREGIKPGTEEEQKEEVQVCQAPARRISRARVHDQTPRAQGFDQTPKAKGLDQTPRARRLGQTPRARGHGQTPSQDDESNM